MDARQCIIYKTAGGTEPYAVYVDGLRDRRAAAAIRVRVTRSGLGNLGDHRSVGRGVVELRIHYGPGYRVYLGLHGERTIVLLCAGDKSTQPKDIALAQQYWQDFRENL